jgi:iron complex outermembrane recepter protein
MSQRYAGKRLLLMSITAMTHGGLFFADAHAGSDAEDSAATDIVGLEEIVVTAQKRTERLQDVPVSISVLSSEALTSRHAVQIEDYFAQVPGLAMNASTSGRVTLAIRGVTTGSGTNPTVGVTIDDVPIGSTAGFTYSSQLVPDIDPTTLERVEVLRGPQGTLYGAASLGGLLRYVTARPKMNEFSGRVQVDSLSMSAGGEGYGARGSANIPLIDDKLAATASAFFRHDPGLVDDPTHGKSDVDSADVTGGRVSTLWQAAENISLRLSALYQHVDGDGSADIDTNLALRPGRLVHDRNPGTGDYERKLQQYDATLTAGLGWGELTSVTGYGVSNFIESNDVSKYLGFFTELATGRDDLGSTAFVSSDTRKFSQEVRLASVGDSRLEWLFGAFYTDETSDVHFDMFATDLNSGAIITQIIPDAIPTSYQERAVFGAATYHFTDRFDIQIGGRSSENEQVYDETIGGPIFDPPSIVHAVSDDRSFTYLFSPRLRLSDQLMAYGRLASGYRPGGPNPGAGFGLPLSFDADTTVSYELGMKGEFLDRRVTLDVSAYYIDWQDIQLSQHDPETELVYYSNAGKARSQGAEVTLQALPAEGLTLVGTLAYSDPQLTQPTNGGIIASAGDRLPYSAEWNGSLSLEQEVILSAATVGFIGGSVTYLGERLGGFAASAITPRVVLPAFTTIDLRAGLTWSDWTLNAFVKNVTDKRVALSAGPEVAASGPDGVFLMKLFAPRTIGMSIAKEF